MKFTTTVLVLAVVTGICIAVPDHANTNRAPSYPLAVRNPYTNFWLPANELPGRWPVFWTGKSKGWTGFVRVDGSSYTFLGNPLNAGQQMAPLAQQTSHFVTPTQTIFGLKAGAVNLTVNFFSPVEVSDIQKQSIPVSYVTVAANSNDGMEHDVEVYMDISAEWASSDTSRVATWKLETTPAGLKSWSTELETQEKFKEFEDYAQWGRATLTASGAATHASGSDIEVRSAFLANGALGNTNDEDFRCISCDWPTFGFAQSLGKVGEDEVTAQYVVGLVREINANFLNTDKNALWLSYWPTALDMIDFFWGDYSAARVTADALDKKILDDAFASQGQAYADILSLSLRQSYAGNEFSGTKEDPIYYQKEISSGAFMQTVDVIYPAAPMFYYLGIDYLRLLLDPLFYHMENGPWTKPFAMHDIGAPYPNGNGQAYGDDMPVEESSNMIMMVGDIVFHPLADPVEARAYAELHYPILSTWANYLVENCLYPVNQLTTDDFIGKTELNSGLALKGILGLATFAKISAFVENTANEQLYNEKVAEYLPVWYMESIHNDGSHLKMEYNITDGYQFKYNAFHDRLLKLNVVSEEVYKMEAEFYLTKVEPYGIPFVSRHDYTKSDWEIWTAAAFGHVNPELRQKLVETLAQFLKITPQRVPFTDWYVTATSNHVGFQARPVAGGHFAILALELSEKH